MKFIIFFIVAIFFFNIESVAKDNNFQAPDIIFNDLNGDNFSLSSRWDKKPILLYFWASWCPYCKLTTPKVVNLNKKYSSAIDILSVNIGVNDSESNARRYIRNFDIDFPVMFDSSSELMDQFSVVGTPVFIIISSNGEILYRSHRYPKGLDETFESMFQSVDERHFSYLSDKNHAEHFFSF